MVEGWTLLSERSEFLSSLRSACCVLEQDTFTPQKYWSYPGSGGSVPTMADMTENLFTGTLSKNETNKVWSGSEISI